jgi:hypothetical protein
MRSEMRNENLPQQLCFVSFWYWDRSSLCISVDAPAELKSVVPRMFALREKGISEFIIR